LSPDGKTLALGDRSGSVTLVDTARGRVRSRLTHESVSGDDPVSALAFSPQGDELAVGTRDHVRLWSISSRTSPTPLVRLPGHRGDVVVLAYDSAGRRLASGGRDKVVEIWDLDVLRRELKPLGLGW
jgi:WD40 repeat protein